jgi:DNA (cytosine-5)-methyltransferase 1
MGYHRAGFDVVGVDIVPQPNYPFEFHQLDVLTMGWVWPPVSFAAIHASPPCQAYSTTAALHDADYPRLIEPVRELLLETGLPFVIENVVGAPLENPIRLCGSSFGLKVWRHRLFECHGFEVVLVPPCSHREHEEPIDVTGSGARRLGDRPDGGGGNSRKPQSLEQARAAMGIDWMSRAELAEAIPPAYTEFVGAHLLAAVSQFPTETAG